MIENLALPEEGKVASIEACPSETADAGKVSACQGCPGQSACASGVSADAAAASAALNNMLKIRMGAIKHKVLVLAGKGGVGKSTLTAGLATALQGHFTPATSEESPVNVRPVNVAVLDVDICGPSQARMMGVESGSVVAGEGGWKPVIGPHGLPLMSVAFLGRPRDAPVVWRGPRKAHALTSLLKDTYWGRRDLLLIDTPPGTSDEHMAVVVALKHASPVAIIVTQPSDLALSIASRELAFCRKMNIPVLGVVDNMSHFVCPCCDRVEALYGDSTKAWAENHDLKYLGAVPLDPNVTNSYDAGKCAPCTHPESRAVAAFAELAANLWATLEGPSAAPLTFQGNTTVSPKTSGANPDFDLNAPVYFKDNGNDPSDSGPRGTRTSKRSGPVIRPADPGYKPGDEMEDDDDFELEVKYLDAAELATMHKANPIPSTAAAQADEAAAAAAEDGADAPQLSPRSARRERQKARSRAARAATGGPSVVKKVDKKPVRTANGNLSADTVKQASSAW